MLLTSGWFIAVCARSLPENFVVQYGSKACCASDITQNLNVVMDNVNGVSKPVLAMTSRNADTGCGAAITCKKKVPACG